MEIPPSLRAIKAYLTHAKQLGKFDPLIAYYCRCYAVQLGVEGHKSQPSDESKAVLMSLLDRLEEDKRQLGARLDDEAMKAPYVTQFALKIFQQADDEDRGGKASRTTARSFYAASIFLNILRQFSDDDSLPQELEDKLKYAKWKAADINTALREGRTPQAGPAAMPVEEESSAFPELPQQPASQPPSAFVPPVVSQPTTDTFTQPPSQAPSQQPSQQPFAPPSQQPTPSQPAVQPVPPAASQPPARPFQPTYTPTNYDSMGVADNNIEAAMRHSKYAVSALQFEDVQAAIKNLQLALASLQA